MANLAIYFMVILCTMTSSCYSQHTIALQTCQHMDENNKCILDILAEQRAQESSVFNMIKDRLQRDQNTLAEIRSNVNRLLEREPQRPGIGTECPQYNSTMLPRDCNDIQRKYGTRNGVFTIYPFQLDGPIQVYCDLYTEGGGWTVFQRRSDGSENFTRPWADYSEGFGDVSNEYWIGNDKLHAITDYLTQELRIEIGDWDGNRRYAKYTTFYVAPETDKYQLSLGKYTGTAGDSMTYHNNMFFSTYDQDNDGSSEIDCAGRHLSGFWFKSCYNADPNGVYHETGILPTGAHGVYWYKWQAAYSYKFIEMKMRPVRP